MLCWRLGVASHTVTDSRHVVCTTVSLRDDFRAYLPELLPRFIGLFAEAERSGNYDQVSSSSSPVPSHCLISWFLFALHCLVAALLAPFKQSV